MALWRLGPSRTRGGHGIVRSPSELVKHPVGAGLQIERSIERVDRILIIGLDFTRTPDSHTASVVLPRSIHQPRWGPRVREARRAGVPRERRAPLLATAIASSGPVKGARAMKVAAGRTCSRCSAPRRWICS